MSIFENIKRAICGESEPSFTPDQQTALDVATSFAEANGFTIVTDQEQVSRDLDTMAERGRKLREQRK
jgi:hypothetical protein